MDLNKMAVEGSTWPCTSCTEGGGGMRAREKTRNSPSPLVGFPASGFLVGAWAWVGGVGLVSFLAAGAAAAATPLTFCVSLAFFVVAAAASAAPI